MLTLRAWIVLSSATCAGWNGHPGRQFCVQVAQEPRSNATVPNVPCVGCPAYGTFVMLAFRVIVNSASGTTVNQTTFKDCMRTSGYEAIPMSEEEWETFTHLPTYNARRTYLQDLLKKTRQRSP